MSATTRLVRFEAVTPLHLGAAEGAGWLYRPTLADPASGLPLVPGSALKGVMAGRIGEASDDSESSSAAREGLYGSPDRGANRGEPSKVVLGDACVLAFPVPTLAGGPAWVVPAAEVARYAGSGPAGAVPALQAEESRQVVGVLEDLVAGGRGYESPGAVLGLPALPPLSSAVRLRCADRPEPAAEAAAERLLRRAIGTAVPSGTALILASPSAARALWELAAERRTQTALTPAVRTVKEGSLRRIELVPAGTVLLGRVTLLDGAHPELGAFQVGAWEGAGLGWLRPSYLDLTAEAECEVLAGRAPVSDAPEPPPAGVELAGLVRGARDAVLALTDAGRGVRIAARAAAYNFGPRARLQGLEAAVAFSLARAHPASSKPTSESRGHRWLLGALLGLGERLHEDSGERVKRCRALEEWAAGEPFAPERFARRREATMLRWLWLRRFIEADLETGDEETGADSVGEERA